MGSRPSSPQFMRSRRSSLNSSDRSPCRRQRRGERSMTIEAQAQKFLVQLGNLGGSAGNGSLRDKLGWTEKTYKRVRQELLDIGSIEVGRGRGGSVRLIAKSARRTHGVRVTVAPPPRRDGGQRSSRMPAAMARAILRAHKTKDRRRLSEHRQSIPASRLTSTPRPPARTSRRPSWSQ